MGNTFEIDKDKSPSTIITKLRRAAEEQLKVKSAEVSFSRNEDEYQRLVHELEVHQIELEMQNAELCHVRYELEMALERYTDLYEFAPVGYFTLDHKGVILKLNLAGASLVSGIRSKMIGRHFGQFLAAASRPAFTEFLVKVLNCKIKDSCDVTLINRGNKPIVVQIEAMATASGQEFRLALIDITERRNPKCGI
jgi:PAS domain-containing protein